MPAASRDLSTIVQAAVTMDETYAALNPNVLDITTPANVHLRWNVHERQEGSP